MIEIGFVERSNAENLLFEVLEENDADYCSIITRDKKYNGKALRAIIVVKGDKTQDILDAIDKLDEKRDNE